MYLLVPLRKHLIQSCMRLDSLIWTCVLTYTGLMMILMCTHSGCLCSIHFESVGRITHSLHTVTGIV